jgi:hypothetical protein
MYIPSDGCMTGIVRLTNCPKNKPYGEIWVQFISNGRNEPFDEIDGKLYELPILP